MSLTGFHLYQFGVFKSGGPVAYFMVIIDGDGIFGVKSYNMRVFYKNTGNPVYRSRDDELIVEADILRVRLDFMVEIRSALRT